MVKIKLSIKEAIASKIIFQTGGVFINQADVIRMVEDIPVVKNNDMVWATSSILASCIYSPQKLIFVDEYFDKAPDYVQEFLLWHEMGHIRNQVGAENVTSMKYLLSRIFGECEAEHIADRYAADIVGIDVALKSIRWIRENCDCSLRDLNKRTDNLIAYSRQKQREFI